jgi:3-octaprenyl-4-hydroxybenzoate carboxy-lyase
VVKSLTNDIVVPADAELTLEGFLDERGYVEPEGPYGEYMGYYGAIHMDPVFHCTAITMRSDVLHHTLPHGSAFVVDQTDSAKQSAPKPKRCGFSKPACASRTPSICARSPAAPIRCASRSDSTCSAKRAPRSRRCSAASCG